VFGLVDIAAKSSDQAQHFTELRWTTRRRLAFDSHPNRFPFGGIEDRFTVNHPTFHQGTIFIPFLRPMESISAPYFPIAPFTSSTTRSGVILKNL
jgi:hypothetical protein